MDSSQAARGLNHDKRDEPNHKRVQFNRRALTTQAINQSTQKAQREISHWCGKDQRKDSSFEFKPKTATLARYHATTMIDVVIIGSTV
jgi:hypothetical protein